MEITTPPLRSKSAKQDVILAYIASNCYAFAEDLMEKFNDMYEIEFTIKKINPYMKG